MDGHGTLCGFVRRLGRWRRLVRDTRAAATIEFAILGSTFILLVCMTLELGLVPQSAKRSRALFKVW